MTVSITPGRFGPLGYGSIDGRPGRFTSRGYDIPGVTSLATGRFGPDGYGADTSMWQSPGDCATGVWTAPVMPPPTYRKSRPYGLGAYGVGPYERYASSWVKPATCSVGTWARAA